MAVAERWEVGEEAGEEGAVREEVVVDEWVEEGAVAFREAEPGGVANLFLLKRMGLARLQSCLSHDLYLF